MAWVDRKRPKNSHKPCAKDLSGSCGGRICSGVCKRKLILDVRNGYIDKTMIFVTGICDLTPGNIAVLNLMPVVFVVFSEPTERSPALYYR